MVDGVYALGGRWNAFPKVVDKNLVHAEKKPPPLTVEEERCQPSANRVVSQPRMDRPIDVRRV
jgi:hypothetical protein